MLKPPLLTQILDSLGEQLQADYSQGRALPSGTGCINETYKISASGRDDLFIKLGPAVHLGMYEQESRGLDLLRQCSAVRVPEIIGCLQLPAAAVLALEYIELSPLRGAGEPRFGEALAHLHQIEGRAFGLDEDNFIGRSHQINGWREDWWDFFCQQRLLPQRRLAQLQGMRTTLLDSLDQLLELIPLRLKDYKPAASLLHGDLWRGNMALDAAGTPVLFDPAVYYGDGETDLAMARMFGGPGADFFQAYHALIGRRDGHELRRNLYDLYHWLNHFNLFGVGYLGQLESALATALDELR